MPVISEQSATIREFKNISTVSSTKITNISYCERTVIIVTLHPESEKAYVSKRILYYILSFIGLHPAFAIHASSSSLTHNRTDSTRTLEAVTVTAIKRSSETDRKTESATILTKTAVERMNITSAKAASAIAPNFYVPDYGSRVTSSIYVRGIGTRIDQPAIGMNVDNVPILNKDNYDFDIFDIANIEIRRGPQSIMFGRNTMGGLIDIRTISPATYQGTRILAEYANASSYRIGVGHYARPSQAFAIGGNIALSATDGFFKNLYNGENCDKERNGRASLKTVWVPDSRLTIENTLSASLVRQGGYAYEYTATKEINYNDTCSYRRTAVIDGLTMRWQYADFSLASITSYQYLNDDMRLDNDFLPLPYFTLTQTKREHAFTEDIVAKSREDARIKWIGGVFGFYRSSKVDAPVLFKDYGIDQFIESKWNEMNPSYPIYWDSDDFVLGSAFDLPNYGIAAYGEVAADFGAFSIAGGLRADYEGVHLDYNSDCSTSYTVYEHTQQGDIPYSHRPVEIHMDGNLRRSFVQLLPKLSVCYNFPRGKGNLYASFSKGYKAGGFNTQMFSDVLQQELMGQMGIGQRYDINSVVGYKPEKSWNYEIGGKFSLADGRVLLDASAFYIDCRDQQLTVFPEGISTGRIMTNAGRTRSTGAELAITVYPVNRLEFRASYGYTNAKFRKYDNGKANYKGNFIPYAPQNTLYAGATYSIPVNSRQLHSISISADASGAGRIYWNEANTASQPLYMLLNGNIRLSGTAYSLDFWIKNATSTQYNTFYFVSIEHEFLQRGKPRQFGATLRINI